MAAANPQSKSEAIREEGVNVLLAELLRERGIQARAERRGRQGTPDIKVELRGGDSIILECKWEGATRPLKKQLNQRLRDFRDALGIVGVLYPYRFRRAENTLEALRASTQFQWWVHGSRGVRIPDRRVRIGPVQGLADQLYALPFELEGTDRVEAAAEVVRLGVEQSARHVSGHARVSHRIAGLIAESDQERDRSAALQIGCLALFNALAFQERLAAINPEVPTIREARGRGLEGLRDTWGRICDEIDYVPVFKLAIDILDVLDDGPVDMRKGTLDALVWAANLTRTLEGHDLSGRLFHTLLTDAKFSGAYYTSVPAATLLARLVFHEWPRGVDWSDHEYPASLNVADLACGTGTLLMAVASEAERLHRQAGGNRAAELHKAMVEQALHGYDVQLSAVHFAATSLAMLNPDIQFDRMNLYVMELGAEGSNVALGSLDFLGTDEATVQHALSPDELGVSAREAKKVYGDGRREAGEGTVATLPDLDLAIMNPPFTRSVGGNLLFGSLPAAERRLLQNELSRRLKSMQASTTAGLGAAFVAAASPRLRPGEGRLALVLPATVCTGPSWRQTRALIESDFTLDMVITSHDPLRWNFSDSTDLSEALLIATRRPANGDQAERNTLFVNLWHNPDGVFDAHRMAAAITTTPPAELDGFGVALLEVDDDHVGEALLIPESKLRGRKWYGAQFSRTDVTRYALKLLDDGVVWIPGYLETVPVALCRLDELGQIGPDRRRLVDGFDRSDSATTYPMIEGHDTEQRKSLLCSPDTYLSPLMRPRGGQKPGYGERLWAQSGRLLIAERLRLNTVRVVAVRSGTEVLSNVWWPVRIDDVSREKALAIWLNSSLGLLTLLAQRTSTEGSWVAMKKADLQEMPVLDVRRISAEQLEELSKLFDQLAEAEFERLPAMAQCPARRALDDGLSEILGLPDLHTLRRLLASEPVVSNQRL